MKKSCCSIGAVVQLQTAPPWAEGGSCIPAEGPLGRSSWDAGTPSTGSRTGREYRSGCRGGGGSWASPEDMDSTACRQAWEEGGEEEGEGKKEGRGEGKKEGRGRERRGGGREEGGEGMEFGREESRETAGESWKERREKHLRSQKATSPQYLIVISDSIPWDLAHLPLEEFQEPASLLPPLVPQLGEHLQSFPPPMMTGTTHLNRWWIFSIMMV